MKPPPTNDHRLRKLEKRVGLLVVLAVCQTAMLLILLVGIMINQLIPGTLTLILLTLGLALLLYVLRHQLPGWFSLLSQKLFARMAAAQKPKSSKDLS